LLVEALVFAWMTIWSTASSPWRWVFSALIAYCLISAPFSLRPVLRMYWNAPAAARKNRDLAGGRTIDT
jgi:hypothetical protein